MPDKFIPQPLKPPNNSKKILLHSCCAPCSGELMEMMSASGIDFTIFFYNPNTHPRQEYEIRKNENISYANKMNVPFVDGDYDTSSWFNRVEGLEFEGERSSRCGRCFDMRFERTALYAHEHGFDVITSSLGMSRWKDLDQVNSCGQHAASRYPHMVYWTHNWRKYGGSERMYTIAKRERFYKQEYCGCVYSLRDANHQRIQKGIAPIEIGKNFYGADHGTYTK
ncbi:MAG: epoxyqueuosine reductase QueH [Candidatus Omnitrophica bacterium]|nr:epoxyqueuosine reductase QueH [Candidatus Omnitrophota bacterium]